MLLLIYNQRDYENSLKKIKSLKKRFFRFEYAPGKSLLIGKQNNDKEDASLFILRKIRMGACLVCTSYFSVSLAPSFIRQN